MKRKIILVTTLILSTFFSMGTILGATATINTPTEWQTIQPGTDVVISGTTTGTTNGTWLRVRNTTTDQLIDVGAGTGGAG